MSGPRFSVIVPTRGDRSSLASTLAALRRQSLAPEAFEVHVVIDGGPAVASPHAEGVLVHALGGSARGPGEARNAGARHASGEWLAFTDDDCEPADDWLERAAIRLANEELHVLHGPTMAALAVNAEGAHESPALIRFDDPASPAALTTNLFVLAARFREAGGFDAAFAEPARDLYFREDSDLVWRLAAAGARVGFAPELQVQHAPLFPDARAVIRHARRHELDPLLASRHPGAFHRALEVKRVAGMRLRRPFHAAALTAVTGWLAAIILLAAGRAHWAAVPTTLAVLAHVVAALRYARSGSPAARAAGWLTPFVYIAALLRGCLRHGGWSVWR